MKRFSILANVLVVLFFGGAFCAWVVSEVRWADVNYPVGRFGNVRENIAYGRLPGHVKRVKRAGETYHIAHSPMDTRYALPSGPAAYVFDQDGQLVDWSHDVDDDPRFRTTWAPRSGEDSTIEELRKLTTQPAK